MNELYFIKSSKINAKLAETVSPGNFISYDGYVYENLIRKPRGRSIERKLTSLKDNITKLIIYK
tara:strand:+ start:2448 stop:2639 length:192 start_codon:yes stop_codon:yes gene_type:complete